MGIETTPRGGCTGCGVPNNDDAYVTGHTCLVVATLPALTVSHDTDMHQTFAAACAGYVEGCLWSRTVYSALLNDRSVFACRSTAYCAGVNSRAHSSSLCATCRARGAAIV